MKTILTSGYTFQPAQKRIDFTSISGFDIRRLFAVIHQPSSRLIYALGTPSLRGSYSVGMLSLNFNTTDASIYKPTDELIILYDMSIQPISATSLPLPSGAAKDTTLVSILDALAPIQNISTTVAKDSTLNLVLNSLSPLQRLPSDIATNTTLQTILQALSPLQRIPPDVATNTVLTQLNATLTSILIALGPLQNLITDNGPPSLDFSRASMAGINPYPIRI